MILKCIMHTLDELPQVSELTVHSEPKQAQNEETVIEVESATSIYVYAMCSHTYICF